MLVTCSLTAIPAVVFACLSLYQLWKLVPADIARTTPGKAVGFWFIPGFNLYWDFVAWRGLGDAMNKTLQRRGIQYTVNPSLGLTSSILYVCCVGAVYCLLFCSILVLIPFIGLVFGIINMVIFFFLFPTFIAYAIVHIFYLKSIKDGAIAMLEQQGA